MGFWIGILAGGVLAWFAVKMRFYETWITFFNIVISIYLAIHLLPIIKGLVPATSETPYGNALTILATAAGVFVILHSISYVFFTSQFNIPFPKIFDILGAGFLGLLAGFLLWSFAGLLICITPISQHVFVKEIGFVSQVKQTNIPYISWWCDSVNAVVSRKAKKNATEGVIEELLKNAEKKPRRRIVKQVDPNEPAEPNDVKTGIDEKKLSIQLIREPD